MEQKEIYSPVTTWFDSLQDKDQGKNVLSFCIYSLKMQCTSHVLLGEQQKQVRMKYAWKYKGLRHLDFGAKNGQTEMFHAVCGQNEGDETEQSEIHHGSGIPLSLQENS